MIQLPLFSSQAQRTLAPQVCGQPALRTNNPLPPPSADVYFSGSGRNASPETLETRRLLDELKATLEASGTFQDYLLNPIEFMEQYPGLNQREIRRYGLKSHFNLVSADEVQQQAKAKRWKDPESRKRQSEILTRRWKDDPDFQSLQKQAKGGIKPSPETLETRRVLDELKATLEASGIFQDYLLNPIEFMEQYPGLNQREIRRYCLKIGFKLIPGKETQKQALAKLNQDPEFRQKQSEKFSNLRRNDPDFRKKQSEAVSRSNAERWQRRKQAKSGTMPNLGTLETRENNIEPVSCPKPDKKPLPEPPKNRKVLDHRYLVTMLKNRQ
jgi:hypothetical protein